MLGRKVPVYYDPAYRLPLGGGDRARGFDSRRDDAVLSFLLDSRIGRRDLVRAPTRVPYGDIARVHTPEFVASWSDPGVLAGILAVDPSEVRVDETLRTFRLAAGATLAAGREALGRGDAVLNLLGGFHHAGPSWGAGFCPLNDIAIAVAALRAEGLTGQVSVLDLDAHPPDGTAACLGGDARVWIGSISGVDWQLGPGVDENVLPAGTEDDAYLSTLDQLLERMPRSEITFVLAGGDVLRGDAMGALALTLHGARTRDLRVLSAVSGRPSVWLPAGGYHRHAWRVLAGTAVALELGTHLAVPIEYDAVTARFRYIASTLEPAELGLEDDLTEEDLLEDLGIRRAPRRRLLGFYTADGIEHGLHRYGVLDIIGRLGFHDFRVLIDRGATGDRLRVFGKKDGAAPESVGEHGHLLVEAVLEKQRVGDLVDALYVHWLCLQDPTARFSEARPQLPGQELPGLGVAREATELLGQMARRLELEAVAFRPAWFHIAYTARYRMHFVDVDRQARFEALIRDLGHLPLLDITSAISGGRVLLNGEPYVWEPDIMVWWLDPARRDEAEVARKLESVRFELVAGA